MASAADTLAKPYNLQELDPVLRKKAESELKENPQKVKAHIASLRRWLSSMPHLKCRNDDHFLLRFLRVAKYDQSRAQLMLDNFCTIRKSPRGTLDWFNYPTLDSPLVQDYLTKPLHLLLGYTKDHEAILMASIGGWDVNKMSFVEFMRCSYMNADLLVADERLQIGGIKVVLNMESASKSQMSHMENPKTMFQAMRNWQDAFPMRMKAVIYVNEPPIFEVFYTIIKNAPFIKPKLKSRLHRVGKNMDKLKSILGPGADELLPKELGGKNQTLDSLLEKKVQVWNLESSQEEWKSLSAIEVYEEKRQGTTKDYLRTFDDKADANMGISGTFTKLNVD